MTTLIEKFWNFYFVVNHCNIGWNIGTLFLDIIQQKTQRYDVRVKKAPLLTLALV